MIQFSEKLTRGDFCWKIKSLDVYLLVDKETVVGMLCNVIVAGLGSRTETSLNRCHGELQRLSVYL